MWDSPVAEDTSVITGIIWNDLMGFFDNDCGSWCGRSCSLSVQGNNDEDNPVSAPCQTLYLQTSLSHQYQHLNLSTSMQISFPFTSCVPWGPGQNPKSLGRLKVIEWEISIIFDYQKKLMLPGRLIMKRNTKFTSK